VLKEFSLGDTQEETAYRTWVLQHCLFINPMNDLVTQSIAATDVLHTPSMVVPIGEPPIYQGFFNQLKQEYTTARYLLYEGLHRRAPRFPDKDVQLVNTLDYPSYGTSIEYVKLAYRYFSVFDKIAYFLNAYLQLAIPEKRVNFQTLWHEKQDRKRPLKQMFVKRPNLPLRGLYWISRDLDDQEDRRLQPDASLLSTIRQQLEHKYLKAHEPEWILAKGDPLLTDTIAYNIDRRMFEEKALGLATIVRAATLYLVLGVHSEEEQRREERGDKRVPGIPLDTHDDDWKR